MSIINVTDAPTISLIEAASLIVALGDIQSQVLLGEPGIGKSSTLGMIARMHGDKWANARDQHPSDMYTYVYIDCVTEEINGIKMRVPSHADGAIKEYLSDSLQLAGSNPRPLVIMLDEFNKGPKVLQSMWARLLLERIIGDTPLPAGSKVYCTSNLVSDGLGDTVQGHVGNRVAFHTVRKPTAVEFAQYLSSIAAHPVVRTFVLTNKRCMGSYTDPSQSDNELIWNPRRTGSVSYCSPRSLVAVSNILQRRERLNSNQLFSVIAGTVGLAAGKLFSAILMMEESIIKTSEIIAHPLSAPVPEDITAQIMLMIRGAGDVETQDDCVAFMQFVTRLPSEEVQSIFFHQIIADPSKAILVRGNAAIRDWRMKHAEILI